MDDTDDIDAMFDSGTSDGSSDVPDPDAASSQAVSAVPGGATAVATGAVNKVTAIDVINSSSGALSGFPTINGVDLNAAGPVNDTSTTFMCRLTLHVKFTLSGIPASEVSLARRIVRTATVMGPDGHQVTNTKMDPNGGPTGDGPSASTIIRPSGSVIAVSDDPGFGGGGTKVFPITYHASFEVFAFDVVENTILGKVSFVVDIAKKSSTDASPTIQLTGVSKTIM